jgi:molybdate transport repressor ModE-like protein
VGDQLRANGIDPLAGGWHRIELRHLLSLEAIAEEQSFVAAATRLGYVQSAVSQQLRTLEELLGVRLVERARGARGGKLTPEGARFLARARTILAEARGAARDLDSDDVIRLAAEPAVSVALLAPVFQRAGAVLEIDEGVACDDLLASVLSGNRDAGCIIGTPPPGFAELAFHRDRWVIASRRGTDVRSSLSELVHIGLRGVTCAFPLARQLPKPVATAESPSTLASMVFAGIGVAIVPSSLVQPWRGQLELTAITAPVDLSLTVRLVWAGNRPPKPALRLLTGQLAAAA